MADAPASGPLALVGSGEFLPAMADVDAGLLDGRPRKVAVIPTAAGPEGDRTIRKWFDLAHAHYERLDAHVVEIDVRDREAAMDRRYANLLDGVGLIYLSGGNPGHLANTLRHTPLGKAVADTWRAGAALAGCSAGAMALGRTTLTMRTNPVEGLGLAGPIATIPHFDRFGFARRIASTILTRLVDDGETILGVDEDTAAVWEPAEGTWRAAGAAKVWLVSPSGGRGQGHAHGETVPLPAPAAT